VRRAAAFDPRPRLSGLERSAELVQLSDDRLRVGSPRLDLAGRGDSTHAERISSRRSTDSFTG
jgi:hypothetical protein